MYILHMKTLRFDLLPLMKALYNRFFSTCHIYFQREKIHVIHLFEYNKFYAEHDVHSFLSLSEVVSPHETVN